MQHSPNYAQMEKLKHIQSQKIIKNDTIELIPRENSERRFRRVEPGDESIFNLVGNPNINGTMPKKVTYGGVTSADRAEKIISPISQDHRKNHYDQIYDTGSRLASSSHNISRDETYNNLLSNNSN